MARLETVPIGEPKHRLPAKLLPLVGEYRTSSGSSRPSRAASSSLDEPGGRRAAAVPTAGAISPAALSRRGQRVRSATLAENARSRSSVRGLSRAMKPAGSVRPASRAREILPTSPPEACTTSAKMSAASV